jgi:hypothetical protein
MSGMLIHGPKPQPLHTWVWATVHGPDGPWMLYREGLWFWLHEDWWEISPRSPRHYRRHKRKH